MIDPITSALFFPHAWGTTLSESPCNWKTWWCQEIDTGQKKDFLIRSLWRDIHISFAKPEVWGWLCLIQIKTWDMSLWMEAMWIKRSLRPVNEVISALYEGLMRHLERILPRQFLRDLTLCQSEQFILWVWQNISVTIQSTTYLWLDHLVNSLWRGIEAFNVFSAVYIQSVYIWPAWHGVTTIQWYWSRRSCG